jgi:hypothetical protein
MINKRVVNKEMIKNLKTSFVLFVFIFTLALSRYDEAGIEKHTEYKSKMFVISTSRVCVSLFVYKMFYFHYSY